MLGTFWQCEAGSSVAHMAPALRLFWPTPAPRHLGEGGPRDSSLLVGWWRESNRAGGSVDVVVAGVVRRAEDLRPIAKGAGRWVDAPRYEGLGPPTLIGRVSGDDGKRVDVPSGSKGGPWIEASRDDDGIPRIDETSGVDASRVLVVLHDPPRPPLRRVSVRSVAAGARRPLRDDETGLEWATRAMELGGRLDRSERRDETTSFGVRHHRLIPSGSFADVVVGRAARAVGHAAEHVARVLDAKVIPGVLNSGRDAHRWRVFGSGGVRWRDSCEVFAVFAAVRSRARSIARSCLGGSFAGTSDDDGGGGVGSSDEAAARRSVAAIAGCAVLIAADVALGFRVADFLLGDVDAVASFAMGGSYRGTGDAWSASPDEMCTTSSSFPLGGHVVSANAEWITHGSPLGVKLHVPLATFLAELATTMVYSLSVAIRTPGCREFMRGVVRVVAWSGRIGGLSLQAALVADVTTFLTTHLAALHVYSSLLVTAQFAAAKRLYLLVSPPRKSLPEEDPRPEDIDEDIAGDVTMHGLSRMEGRVFGTLALAPVALLSPTTVAFYLSYLALHALTVFARAAMVLVSATLQHPRMDLVALRLCHPAAFPGGVTIDAVGGRGTEDGRPRVARLRARPAPWHAPLAPFAAAAAGWTGGLVGAVARACGSFGRLPVAVVPFEPARVSYFD